MISILISVALHCNYLVAQHDTFDKPSARFELVSFPSTFGKSSLTGQLIEHQENKWFQKIKFKQRKEKKMESEVERLQE